jgi:glycosyltransferase involved in cell wall biosynthesis
MENYVLNILDRLLRRDPKDLELLCLFTTDHNHHLADFPDPRVRRVHLTADRPAPDQVASALRQHDIDVLFCPLIDLEPRDITIPSFVTIPDLQHEALPGMFDPELLRWRREAYPAAVSAATGVFTLSEYSRQSMIDAYGTTRDHVSVVHLDVDDAFRDPAGAPERTEVRRQYDLSGQFILYPAVTWPHKNHTLLLRALASYLSSRPPITLVLTGSAGDAHEKVLREIRRLRLERYVRMLGFVPQRDLACLYAEALALIFPSLYEGFGLPILEAFHAGCPVICSNRTSCPEIGGDAAVYVNPEDPEAIAAALGELEQSPRRRDELVQRGRARSTLFSWERAEQVTYEVMRDASDRYRAPIAVASWPRITVVTPSFNHAPFIRDTIESVLGQGYPHLDYLVIDGGSTDGTVDILKSYGSRFRWVSEPDQGQADAVNKGVAMGNGQVVGWLNSDDVYTHGALEKIVRPFVTSSNLHVLYGDADHMLEDGTFFRPYPTASFNYQRLASECFICQPATFFRRDAFHEVGELDTSLQYCMDYDLWIRLGRRHRFGYLPAVLARSRLHGSTKTLGRRGQVFNEIIRTVRRHYGFVPFAWAYGSMDFLLNRSEREVFEAKRRSLAACGAGVLYGLWLNRSQPSYWKSYLRQVAYPLIRPAVLKVRTLRLVRRFVLEPAGRVPDRVVFEGRWPDGWISRRYLTEVRSAPGVRTLTVRGRHEIPGWRPLRLTLRLNAVTTKDFVLRQRGPFSLTVTIPDQPAATILEIEANRTFCPLYRGHRDSRKLSCVIDEVRVD